MPASHAKMAKTANISTQHTARVLGIHFFQGTPEEAVWQVLQGGLTVAPSGPNLADMDRMPAYRQAVLAADTAVLDSGFLVLCWKTLQGERLSRLSGLLLLETMLANVEQLKRMTQLWVMPTEESLQRTKGYLAQLGLNMSDEQFYVAPHYAEGAVSDEALQRKVEAMRPDLIMVNVAGGKQEVLGHWLLQQLDYRPAVICTGAAIAFKTGEQANIPKWGDRLFLGWLLRIFSDPSRYLGRYWRARRLWKLIKRYGAEPPPENV